MSLFYNNKIYLFDYLFILEHLQLLQSISEVLLNKMNAIKEFWKAQKSINQPILIFLIIWLNNMQDYWKRRKELKIKVKVEVKAEMFKHLL